MRKTQLMSAVFAAACLAGPALAAPKDEQEPARDELNQTVRPQPIQINPGQRAPVRDMQLPPDVELEKKQPPEQPDTRVSYERFTASGERLTQVATVVHRGPAFDTALQGFNFRFTNGWHKIMRIGALNEGEEVRASFNDDGGEDPFHFEARYIKINWSGLPNRYGLRGDYREVFAVDVDAACAERCSIEIPSASPHHTAVLRGFEFARRGSDDYNVRALSITLLPDRGVADVRFYDDRNADFSGGRFDFGMLLMPPPVLAESVARSEASRLPYQFKLQLLYVPNDIVEHAGRVIGGSREDADFPRFRSYDPHPEPSFSEDYPYALMGFGVAFGNSDHFLEAFGVDPESRPVVTFQDGDTDDPISWFFDYVAFKREVFDDPPD